MNETRHYPSRPIVGVGGVVFMDDGRVVLAKRGHAPSVGSWTLPGGVIDLGETAAAAVAREMFEETGLIVDVGPVVDVVDRIFVDDAGRIEYHFVVVDYLCHLRGGTMAAGSDVVDVVAAKMAMLEPYQLTEAVQTIVMRAAQMNRA